MQVRKVALLAEVAEKNSAIPPFPPLPPHYILRESYTSWHYNIKQQELSLVSYKK